MRTTKQVCVVMLTIYKNWGVRLDLRRCCRCDCDRGQAPLHEPDDTEEEDMYMEIYERFAENSKLETQKNFIDEKGNQRNHPKDTSRRYCNRSSADRSRERRRHRRSRGYESCLKQRQHTRRRFRRHWGLDFSKFDAPPFLNSWEWWGGKTLISKNKNEKERKKTRFSAFSAAAKSHSARIQRGGTQRRVWLVYFGIHAQRSQ